MTITRARQRTRAQNPAYSRTSTGSLLFLEGQLVRHSLKELVDVLDERPEHLLRGVAGRTALRILCHCGF